MPEELQDPPASPAQSRVILPGPDVFVAAVGQGTAILGVAAAVVYLAGALSLAFKLWYDDIPVLPVLVQLPRNWPISQAVTQLVPAALGAAILAVFAWNRIRSLGASKRFAAPPNGEDALAGEVWRWGVSLSLALIFTAITVFLVHNVWIIPVPANLPPPADGHEAMKGIFLRPWWNVALISLVLGTLCLRVALYIIAADLRRTNLLRSMPKDAFRVAVLAVFFTPVAASMISAANSLPIAKLCGPGFSSAGSNGNYTIGSLIGINGQYAYLAEVLTQNKDPKHFQFASGYVAIIPLSEANQISIGVNARCYQQAPPKPRE